MSLASVEVGVGDPGAGLYFSASSMQRFTDCEERWLRYHALSQDERQQSAPSEAMLLGTLMHTLLGAWWAGREWEWVWVSELDDEIPDGAAYRLSDGGIIEVPGWEAPRHFLRARKIMEAWVEVHGRQAPWPLVSLELPFDLPLPGVRGVRVKGYIDGLVRQGSAGGRDGDLMLLEFKTMGRWGKERRVSWDPQLHLYLWAAKQLFDVQGVVYEAISTYDYKTGPTERRFQRITLPYDERMVERAVSDVRRAAVRAKQLLSKPELAVRSVGERCDYCPFHRPCLTPWET